MPEPGKPRKRTKLETRNVIPSQPRALRGAELVSLTDQGLTKRDRSRCVFILFYWVQRSRTPRSLTHAHRQPGTSPNNFVQLNAVRPSPLSTRLRSLALGISVLVSAAVSVTLRSPLFITVRCMSHGLEK